MKARRPGAFRATRAASLRDNRFNHVETKAKQSRVVDAAGSELEALLAPISPSTFVNEYWGKKPLFVKGFRDKFKGLFDGAAFTQAVASPGGAPPDYLRASFDKKGSQRASSAEPEDVGRTFPVPPELAGTLFEQGATLCVTEIQTRVPRLAHFVAAIKRQLGYPGKVSFSGYLSPAGAGFNWHFDGRVASTLQIEGSKRWRFSNRASIDWPRGNGVMMTDGTARYGDSKTVPRAAWERLEPLDKKKITEVVLEPGDLLILPAGVWHDACGGNTGSLALNLSFNPIPYTSLIGDLLDSLLASDPGWRGPSPMLPTTSGRPGEVDPRGLESLSRQLRNAAEALQSMAADSSAMVKLWSSFVQNASPPIAAPGPSVPIAETDRFRVRADGNLYVRSTEHGTRLSVWVGARSYIEVAEPAMGLLSRALSEREFAASDCMSWGDQGARLAWTDVEPFLSYLVSEGLLERAPSR